jgi:single-stranded-DNA-specific exonuclease
MDETIAVQESLSGRRWVWRPAGPARLGEGLAQTLGLPELIGRLLAARGLDAAQAPIFLAPTLRALLPDPSTLADMDRAAERLADAVQARETVAVFGDYDVDGACSAALMVSTLRRLGCPVLHHVPDRLLEGYGPNPAALLALAGQGAGLIVCVDCGTAAHAAFAPLAGRADIIVFDHHKAEAAPPPILATVNPNRPDCTSGLTTLCAAGVAFLGAVALLRSLRRRGHFTAAPEPDLRDLLDLVALATICDVMPLTGLNRAFVAQGLRIMAQRARPGLAALLDVARLTEPPNAGACGFALGPRINAAGRIAAADMGLRLLLEEDADAARRLAERLDEINRERQIVEAGILEAAMAQAAAQMAAGHQVLVLAAPGWHPGVVGIVAGRVKERFHLPALVAGIADGVAKGSGRSVTGLDLGAAIIAAREAGLLATGGGHAMAAGFSLSADGLGALHEFLEAALAGPRAAVPALTLEGTLGLRGADAALADMVGQLGPFGAGNPEPLFMIPRARVVAAERIGKDGATLRLMLEGEGGGRLKALLFRASDSPLSPALTQGGPPLHLAGHLRAERWQGRVSAGFFIADAAPA